MAKKTVTESAPEYQYPKVVDTRLNQIYATIDDLKVDSLVVTYLPNIRYLTNFSGSAGTLFITEKEMIFVTDDRYEEQIKDELFSLPNFKTYISRDPWTLLKKEKLLKGVSSMAFESDRMSYSDAVQIRNVIRPIKFKPYSFVVERFTQPKSTEEVDCIRKAGLMALEALDKVIPLIKPGVSEREISIELDYQAAQLGSEGVPFDTIVVSGPRCSLIHGMPSSRKFKKGDVIIVDWGTKYKGFASDLTRTFVIGKPTKEQKQIYKLILNAKDKATESVLPGMNGKTLDNIARNMIKKEGFGDYFKHSLGHGVGYMVHEFPIITFRKDDQIIPENVVLAIEPGVYLPDKFGIRIEDEILVTKSGGKPLTIAPDDIISL
jgi:Xaa-Pro aminopeptidase